MVNLSFRDITAGNLKTQSPHPENHEPLLYLLSTDLFAFGTSPKNCYFIQLDINEWSGRLL